MKTLLVIGHPYYRSTRSLSTSLVRVLQKTFLIIVKKIVMVSLCFQRHTSLFLRGLSVIVFGLNLMWNSLDEWNFRSVLILVLDCDRSFATLEFVGGLPTSVLDCG